MSSLFKPNDVIIVFLVSVALLLIFMCVALYKVWREKHLESFKPSEPSAFITTKLNTWSLWWSFYGAYCGSWVIFMPASFSYDAGIIGCIMYSTSLSVSLIVLTRFSKLVTTNTHNSIKSLTKYLEQRYGVLYSKFILGVLLVCLFLGLIAEYTSLLSFFKIIGNGIFLSIFVFFTTFIYTYIGGLKVSILTDVYQGFFSVLCMFVVLIYMLYGLKNYEFELSKEVIGLTKIGIGSIAAMPISMICAVFFREAPWQRSFAAMDNKTLNYSVVISSIAITLTIILFGGVGVLARASNLEILDKNNILITFISKNSHPKPFVLLLLFLAVVLNQASVDGLQTAIVGLVAANITQNKKRIYFGLFVTNVVSLYIATFGESVLEYYLVINLLCTLLTPSIVLSFLSKLTISQNCAFISCFFGFLCLCFYAFFAQNTIVDGFRYIFIDNYGYESFSIALIAPSFLILCYNLLIKMKN